MMLFISPSGNGVKGIIKIPKSTQDEHSKIFKKFEDEYQLKYLDAGGSNVDRVCFESYDKDLYVNLDSKIYSPNIEDVGFKVNERVPILPVTDESTIVDKIMLFCMG